MFKKTFCPSPWFHARINNSGHYEYCRWADKTDRLSNPGIHSQDPVYWFQYGMSDIRKDMLDGQDLPGCIDCRVMEQHGKVSGRQKQLLKIGVNDADFEKTMLSSLWFDEFSRSQNNNGDTHQVPQDWQVDLGNFCNSACLFCDPASSSRLASEFKKIGFIDQLPRANWAENPNNLDCFVNALSQSDRLTYLHFIGGETLITPSFKKILEELIDKDLAKQISIGFTTNLTVWDNDIVKLLKQFREINLGMSVECLHPLNDYVRYGGNLATTERMMKRWIDIARQEGWLIQLRITPTLFTVYHLHTVYDFAIREGLAVESCNFLSDPAHMRPSVLPAQWRQQVIERLQSWIDTQGTVDKLPVINTRNPNLARQQVLQDAASYVDYLRNQPDESHRLGDLVKYIKTMESSRGNNILDYLPEYEELLRSAGY